MEWWSGSAVSALVGLASGFASGLFGIGGGIVRIPLFVYLLPLFGVAHSVMMHVAVGTSMALVLPSAIASTRKQVALGISTCRSSGPGPSES